MGQNGHGCAPSFEDIKRLTDTASQVLEILEKGMGTDRYSTVKRVAKGLNLDFAYCFLNLKGAGFLRLLQVCVRKHIPQLLSIIYDKQTKYASI